MMVEDVGAALAPIALEDRDLVHPQGQYNNVILLADDEGPMRGVLSYVLEIAGFQVVTAADGFEALRLAHRYRPLVALLDLRMPRMSGSEVCAVLRSEPSLASTFVIVISVAPPHELETAATAAGADMYLSKPVDHECLLRVITTVFEHRASYSPCRLLHA